MEPQKSSTIFINPKFKNAYINPNFLKNSNIQQQTQIHINPKFILNHQQVTAQQQNSQLTNVQQHPKPSIDVVNNSAIIKNTKRSLIRAPVKIESSSSINSFKDTQTNNTKKMNLIRLSNTKLVNATHLMKYQQKENEIIKKKTESLIQSKKLLKKSEMKESSSIYKLDRRKLSPGINKTKKRIVVSQYSIRKIDASDILTPKKVIVSGRKLLST